MLYERRVESTANEIQIDVALGQAVWALRGTVRAPVLHWMTNNKLLAVAETSTLSFGIRNDISTAELDTMHVIERPESAGDIPLVFRHSTLDWVLWRFARYADNSFAQLPKRFESSSITLLRQPPVPQVWVSATQREILRRLSNGPALLDELKSQLKLSHDTLLRELVGLYFTRSIHAAKKPSLSSSNWSMNTFKGWVSSQAKDKNSGLSDWQK
jgi:hypothetical protein